MRWTKMNKNGSVPSCDERSSFRIHFSFARSIALPSSTVTQSDPAAFGGNLLNKTIAHTEGVGAKYCRVRRSGQFGGKGVGDVGEGERENEADVEAVEEKASWFAELDEFVTNLARFMEEKVGAVEEAESEALELQVRRCRMLGRRRARWLEARFERCFEVKLQRPIVPDFASAGEEQGDGDVEMNEDENTLKGEGEAEIDATQLDKLSAADELSYTLASDAILTKLQEAFADVSSTEYLDPTATVSSTSQELHPRSIVSRFEEYRQRYPEEYSQIWGGLSVAQIWDSMLDWRWSLGTLFPLPPLLLVEVKEGGRRAPTQFRTFVGSLALQITLIAQLQQVKTLSAATTRCSLPSQPTSLSINSSRWPKKEPLIHGQQHRRKRRWKR